MQSSLTQPFHVKMKRTQELLQMKLDGFAEGIELVLNVSVSLMAEPSILGLHTVEEMAHIQARFGGPFTRHFGTSRHRLLERATPPPDSDGTQSAERLQVPLGRRI